MAKRKNLKADKPEFTGRIIFDGNLQLRIPGHGIKTLRTDLAGMSLHHADPNKEILVLCKFFVNYNEIHTGYIVRPKQYDGMERPCFGLKDDPNANSWTVINYCDVIAWGYADGGLNDPTLFYSCQSTKEEEEERERLRAEKGMKTHAEVLAEREAEMEEVLEQMEQSDGLVVKLRDTEDSIDIETSWPKAKLMDYLPFVENDLADCFKAFDEFRKKHPDFHEMHFLTDQTVWEKELEEEETGHDVQ